MGVCRNSSRSRISAVSSVPSQSGMYRSISTRSGWKRSIASMILSPSCTTSASMPALRRMDSAAGLAGSSSTTRMRRASAESCSRVSMRDHLVRSLRIEQQRIGAGTACGQAGHGVGPAQHQQPDRCWHASARYAARRRCFPVRLELGIDQDDVRRQRRALPSVPSAFPAVPVRMDCQALVELDRQLAAFGQVVDALCRRPIPSGSSAAGRRGAGAVAGGAGRMQVSMALRVWRKMASGGCADVSGCRRNGSTAGSAAARWRRSERLRSAAAAVHDRWRRIRDGAGRCLMALVRRDSADTAGG